MRLSLGVSTEVLASDEAFEAVVRGIIEAKSPVHLDLEDFRLDGARRFHPLRLLLLSNVLAGAGARTPVHVVLPRSDTARLAVMRSGLMFSLVAHRVADESLVEIPGVGQSAVAAWRDLWSQPWSPREPAVGRLFDDEPRIADGRGVDDEASVLGNPNNAKRATRVVVDPHRRSREFLHANAPQGLAQRWLRLVTPSSADRSVIARRETWMNVVSGRVLTEPLLNLADHAIKCPPRVERRAGIRSLAVLARTDGGQRSYPRLQMLVADTGYGIVNTYRPKLASAADEDMRDLAEASAERLLEHVLMSPAKTAKDPGLPWARTGFQVATKEAEDPQPLATDDSVVDAEFSIITADPDNADGAIWVTAGRDGLLTQGRCGFVPFTGTTVFATLPMPRPVAEAAPTDGVAAGARS